MVYTDAVRMGMYLVDKELARGYLKHQARVLKEQMNGLQWQ